MCGHPSILIESEEAFSLSYGMFGWQREVLAVCLGKPALKKITIIHPDPITLHHRFGKMLSFYPVISHFQLYIHAIKSSSLRLYTIITSPFILSA